MQDLGNMLALMQREAVKRHAPVFMLEKGSAKSPFHILVATMLSPRTKDEVTTAACNRLFAVAKTPQQLLTLPTAEMHQLLRGIGFYRIKTRHLKTAMKMLISEFHGEVPHSLEQLMKLPGVGRKVGNIVLARAYSKLVLGVDTHVQRISNRLGWVKTKKPEETERQLMRLVPRRYLLRLNRIFVAYGQTICVPVSPFCTNCKIRKYCKRIGVKRSR
ncbi:MAG: endonuclease III [Candidatus Micrarchaeota archaeon]